jgi:hypothetical protein
MSLTTVTVSLKVTCCYASLFHYLSTLAYLSYSSRNMYIPLLSALRNTVVIDYSRDIRNVQIRPHKQQKDEMFYI